MVKALLRGNSCRNNEFRTHFSVKYIIVSVKIPLNKITDRLCRREMSAQLNEILPNLVLSDFQFHFLLNFYIGYIDICVKGVIVLNVGT